MSTRQAVKTAIQIAVQGATGVGSVFTYKPKIQQQTDFPSVIVALPKSREERASASAPVGKKRIKFTAQLEIFNIDASPDGVEGQADFDNLLDAIDTALRADPTLNGAVLSSTIEYIQTTVASPQLVNGQNVAMLAVKQFDVVVQVTG